MVARKVGSKSPEAHELLNREEAAAYLGVAAQTLAIWKVTGRYSLPVIKVGRLTRYRRSDLDSFLNQRTVDTSLSRVEKKTCSVPAGNALDAAPFAEVKLVEPRTETQSSAAEDGTMEVILPNGIKLRLSENCSLGLLSSVMSVLERY